MMFLQATLHLRLLEHGWLWRQQKPERSQVHRIVPHHSSIRPLPKRRTHRLIPAAGVRPVQGLLLRRALCGTRKASKLSAKTHSKVLSSDGWTQSKVSPGTLYHTARWPRARFTVTTSSWNHLWMGWARSKQRYVTISRPRGLLSWVQAETAKSAFSNAPYAGWNTDVAARGLPIRLRLNRQSTCATWTVRERKV